MGSASSMFSTRLFELVVIPLAALRMAVTISSTLSINFDDTVTVFCLPSSTSTAVISRFEQTVLEQPSPSDPQKIGQFKTKRKSEAHEQTALASVVVSLEFQLASACRHPFSGIHFEQLGFLLKHCRFIFLTSPGRISGFVGFSSTSSSVAAFWLL